MDDFIFEARPARVLFGAGSRNRLGQEAGLLGMTRAMIVTTASQVAEASRLADQLGPLCQTIFARAAMHTPVAVTDEAMAEVERLRIDGIIALGGGSAIGLGKAIALRTGLDQIALPSTYAGSEMTPILGETQDGRKVTRSDPAILPETVIYDVELTATLPPSVAAVSGVNAMAHAIEALYARDRNPVVTMLALESIRALFNALPRLATNDDVQDAREQTLYGAFLAGRCLGAVGMALHHKLCHVLGGLFGLPHAPLHTALLPHALAYNAPAIPDALLALEPILGACAPQALFDMNQRLGAIPALRDLGMPLEGIEPAVDQALATPYWNPQALDRSKLTNLLRRVWAGDAPYSPPL